MLRFVLLFILFYVVFRLIRIFVKNFKLGANDGNNIRSEKKSSGRSHSKYENVEDAEFTEIEPKEENHKK